MAAPCILLAALICLLVSTTPIVQSALTWDDVNAGCKQAQVVSQCDDVLMTNLDPVTAAVKDVPAMSIQVAVKLTKEALRFSRAVTEGTKRPSKCFDNCANDINIIAKKLEGLPAEIKPDDEASIVSFYDGFQKTCGNDCPDEDEGSDEEKEIRYKFNDVMYALDVVKDLLFRREWFNKQHEKGVQTPSA